MVPPTDRTYHPSAQSLISATDRLCRLDDCAELTLEDLTVVAGIAELLLELVRTEAHLRGHYVQPALVAGGADPASDGSHSPNCDR